MYHFFRALLSTAALAAGVRAGGSCEEGAVCVFLRKDEAIVPVEPRFFSFMVPAVASCRGLRSATAAVEGIASRVYAPPAVLPRDQPPRGICAVDTRERFAFAASSPAKKWRAMGEYDSCGCGDAWVPVAVETVLGTSGPNSPSPPPCDCSDLRIDCRCCCCCSHAVCARIDEYADARDRARATLLGPTGLANVFFFLHTAFVGEGEDAEEEEERGCCAGAALLVLNLKEEENVVSVSGKKFFDLAAATAAPSAALAASHLIACKSMEPRFCPCSGEVMWFGVFGL